MPLFQGLGEDQLNEIYHRLRYQIVDVGLTFTTVDEPGGAAYIIVSGTVKAHVQTLDGSDVILAILGPGEIFGEMSISDSMGHSASPVTLEETSLLWVDRGTFHEWLQTIPAMAYNLIGILSRRLRLANAQIESLATFDVYRRVARQILAYAQEYGQSFPTATL